ncbi:MAG: ORF6N domain-containing protein [Candidatus Omnitrophica bacterium]|nr:ORF6N domain-containing protein [Candidatus Omnitrophota bacterium]
MPKLIAVEVIATKILEIRGRKVMLDRDLAKLYDAETKHLTRQVRRNIKRFPVDFMIRLTRREYQKILRRQIGTLEKGRFSKYLPYAFSEQGVAMLSSVLNSERAIQVNILIMRAFTKIKEILLTHKELAFKIEALERKYTKHDQTIKEIFESIRQLLRPPPVKEKKIIGFHVEK